MWASIAREVAAVGEAGRGDETVLPKVAAH